MDSGAVKSRFEELVKEIEEFYRDYFNFSREEEQFLFLYMTLKRKRGMLNKEVLRVPSNVEKLIYMEHLIRRKLKEVER